MIKVLLADDHILMREGMKQLISFSDDILVTGEASTGEEVLKQLAEDMFDVVLLDVTMPGISGAELIAEIRKRKQSPPILILTMHNEQHIVKNVLDAGAAGFLTKDCPPDMLEQAIHKVATGVRYIQPDIAGKLLADPLPKVKLSPQELRILKMLAQGLRVIDIAAELGLSSRTISTHKTRLMRKLDIDNDAALIRYADAQGLK
jgi:DNA-binding NarL/FixJ family response regulator